LEHFRIGREYNRQKLFQYRRREYDLSTKIWLMHEALRAMPENLRAAAEVIDETPPPADQPVPRFHTPPIPDFEFEKYMPKSANENSEEGNQSDFDDDDD
jgi:hypothetical protein